MIKKILLLLTCLCSFLQADTKTLIVGTNAEFPPFSYIENQAIVGFDIDIAKEVAVRLGKKIQFKDMPFDALIPDILLGQIDFVAAGMSFTEERAKRVSFTKPYLTGDPLILFSSKIEPLGADALKNKTIVVVEGFTADLYMSERKDITLLRLPSQADGFMAIKSHRADAFVTAKSTVDAFFEVQKADLFHTEVLKETGEKYALIVPKSNPKMLEDLQKALDEMEKDGTLAKLKTKWKLS